MRTYSIPEGPEGPVGPVWDKDGHKWERLRDDLWFQDGARWTVSKWFQVLHRNGPLTDTPPVKVGDKVTLTEFSKMPDWSIAGGFMSVFTNCRGHVFTDRQEEGIDLSCHGFEQVTILRVGLDGGGEE